MYCAIGRMYFECSDFEYILLVMVLDLER